MPGAQAPASTSRDWSFFEQGRINPASRAAASQDFGGIRIPSANRTPSGSIDTETLEKYISPRDATLYDLTIGSIMRGYDNSQYGIELYKQMSGQENDADEYAKKMASEKYRFEADGLIGKAVSGASELLGQQLRQWTDPTAIAAGGTAAGAAAIAGQAGPQVLIPEEVFTVPGAFIGGLQVGSGLSNYQIEAGLAYKEMLDNGISEDTASKVATAVGGANAALELVQMDELVKSFQVLNKSGASNGVLDAVLGELKRRGMDVAKETAQEVAQEGVTITGSQVASQIDRGEWQYGAKDVVERLGDTALSSALSFGVLNVPGGVYNVAYGNRTSSPQQAQQATVAEQEPTPVETEISAPSQEQQSSAREAAILRILEENGVTGTPANRQAQGVAALIDGGELSSHRADEIRKSRAAQAAYTHITGETIDTTGRPAEVRARIKQMALDKAAERNAQNVVETIPTQAAVETATQEATEAPVTPVTTMGTVYTNQAETSPVIQYTPSPASDLDTISQRVYNINLVDRMAQDSQVLGEAGRAAAMTRYDGTTDPSGYYAGFMQAYNDGMNGKRNRQNSVLTKEQYNQAYNAGRTDARAGLTREGAGLVRNASAVKLRDAGTIDSLAKKLGVTVVAEDTIFSPDGRKSGANGYIKGREIHIALDAEDPAMVVFKHEVTHYLQEQNAKGYQAFRDYAVQAMGEDEVRKVQDLYRRGGVELTWDGAMDEVAANYTENLLTDEEAVRRLIRDDRNLAQKILDAIRDMVRNLTDKEGAQLRKAERLWTKMFEESVEMRPLTEREQAIIFSDRDTKYSIREKDPPKKTGVAYKVFFAKDGQLYPPMVANPGGAGTPVGVWLDADIGQAAPPSKTGRMQVQAGGKGTNAAKGSLAFRPGWHLGDIPLAKQFARKNPETGVKDLFPADFVWAECEYAMDVDYQEEAMSYGYTENGKFRHSYAGLPKLPQDGYYRYRTNPNPDTVPWVITGAMKVNRILTDAETDAICREAGVEPMKRQGGPMDEERLSQLGLKAGYVEDNTRFSMKSQVDEMQENYDEIAGQEQADRGTMEVRYSVQNLTPEERSAILSYKSSESYKVNAKLREGIALTDMEQAMVDELDRALEKLPKVQGTVYRTLNFDDVLSPQEEYEDFIAKHQAGFLVAYKAYTSASTKTDGYPLADGTKYGVTLEITSRSARDLAGLGNNFESEALFPRRTVFDITRVTTDKSGHIRIYMEEVEIYGGNKHQGHDTQKRGMAVRDLQEAHPAHTDLRDVPRTDTRGDHVRGQNLQESGTEGTSEQEVTRFSLKQENQRLRELNQYLREEISDPSVVRTSRNGVKKLASRLVSEYDSTVDKSDISAQLLSLYDFIANGKDASGNELTWTEVSRRAKEIAQDILSGAVAQGNPLYEEYADVRSYVKQQAIVVPKDSRGDFEQFGGWGAFRKLNAGRMKLMNDGLPSDVFYQELSSQWPELFPEDIANPADQMIHTAEVLQYLDAVYENPYQQEMDVYTRYLADEILESFYEVPQRTTYAQRQQLRQTKQAIRYEKRIDSLRQRQKERIADLRAQGRDRIKQAVAEQREESAKKLDALKRKYQGKEAATRDRREAAATRAKIQRHVKKLSQLLLRPSDKSHVPEALKKPVAALLESINLESQYTVDPKTGKRKKNGGGDPTKRTQAFQELRTAYAKIMESGEYLVDPDLQDNLDAVIRMKNKRLVEMNQAELETVWKAVSAMEASIRSANKLLAHSKFESISGIADSLRRENSSKPEKRNYVRPIGLLDGLLNLDMMTPEIFFHRLGDPGDAIFRMMRNAADDQTRTLKEAEDYTKALLDGMKARDLEKELHTFRIDGQDVELSTAQIMELYVLSRRQQAVKHLYMGGIRPTGARKGVLELGAAKPVHVTPQDVANIISTLTDDQILVAEGMQSFLSEEMAEKGNRASMKVYGYKKFSEENYWPIRVDNNQTVTDVAKETAEKMVPQYGMTKQVTPGANNALFIGSIFDSYAKHITEMSIYSAWLATWEDVNRIHNFQFRNSEGARTGTVKEIVSKVFGKNGNGYITNLLRDVSQGTKANADTVFSIRGLTSAYKAASVGANLRVILQQPTAALRALDLIDPKYFLAGMARKGNWDRVKKWAPIAQWKDWGYFEMDTGRAIKDVLLGTDSVLERVKQATMWAAGKADSVTWSRIWNACEAEIADKRPGLKKGSDEFYRAVADRFNQVIDQTQVVDSALTRTQIMRSSSDLNKMAASFMSEPSKVYNMMLRSVYDLRAASDPAARSAARKRVGRTSFALVASFAANAIAQSLVDAARDDDREKKYLERFVAAYEKNFIANFNPAGYVPYLRDIVSIIQGYDVSRMDMDSISKAINSATNAYKALSGGGKKTVKAAFADLFAEFSRLLGVPVSNIKRDVQSVIMTTAIETENYRLQYEIDRALLNLNYAGNTALFMDTLYGAMKTNRADYEFIYSDLVKNGMDPAKIASGMESRMKADQGVTSVSDLEQRYLPPDKEKEYQSLLSGVSGTKIWAGATEEQRKNASDDIYQLIMGTDRSASLRDKISAGSQYGLTEEEMVLYELAKEVASQDGNDNTSQEEAAAAAAMLPGLSDNERAYLWQSTNKGWKDTNNPWK